MRKNVLQSVIAFIFRYIWIFCALLIVLEVFSTVYTAGVLTEKSAQGLLTSVEGEVYGRVQGVMRMLKGIATDKRFYDTTIPLYDRAVQARPYQASYELYMIALCDENVNVISADETEPPAKQTSLAHREYMQRLYTTGEPQITDAFPAGADGVTLNYTIAVPMLDDGGIVTGCVFGSLYFDEIQSIITRNVANAQGVFYLMSSEQTIMVGDDKTPFGTSFAEIAEDVKFFGVSSEQISNNIKNRVAGAEWEWDAEGLHYATYRRVNPTNWTLVYRASFWPVLLSLLPVMSGKALFYVIICALIAYLGQRYLRRNLAAVNHLLDRVSMMQQELMRTEYGDYEGLIELTQQGLTDQLTGLATRGVFFSKAERLIAMPGVYGAVLFLDLDDLKIINDTFGHDAGDRALAHFGHIIKQYGELYHGAAARYGGDEFVLVLGSVGEAEAEKIANELCTELCTDLIANDKRFTIHGSVGGALFPEQGQRPEELVSKADFAMYHAKQSGKNKVAFFTEGGAAII